MNCQDVREGFSDWRDDALEPEARARVDAHLAGCADCRRELDRFEQTVSLLRAVERPRAPVGFVDRVLEAARPTPWYRRLGDRLARIRPLRLPVEAAGVLLVATLAVYVFQQTPELKQAARPGPPASAIPEGPAPRAPGGVSIFQHGGSPDTSAERETPAREPATRRERQSPVRGRVEGEADLTARPKSEEVESRIARDVLQAPLKSADGTAVGPIKGPQMADEPASPPPPVPAPAAPQSAPPGTSPEATARFRRAQDGPPTVPLADGKQGDSALEGTGRALSATPAPPPVPGAAVSPSERRDKAREQVERLAQTAAPPPAASALQARPSPNVAGRLTVRDRQVADRDLAELLGRLGGVETARRSVADAVVVEVVVPRTAYAAFAHGLARIGSWTPDAEPSELPANVLVTLRIGP